MSKRNKSSKNHIGRAWPAILFRSWTSLGVLAGAALIAGAVFVVYLPTISGGFVLDDDVLLTENKLVKGGDGLYRFWCSAEAADYWPATYTSFWLEWRLWGRNPTGYHATNLALHIVEALLVWLVLRKLSIPGAFLAGAIFAVHPVNVESAAWIASRKNMMAMLFFLLSILWYVKAEMFTAINNLLPTRSHGGSRERENYIVGASCETASGFLNPSSFIPHLSFFYWLSLAAFVLAMLGKGSAAVLPVMLLGIVWWQRPLRRCDLVRTAPFFLVAVMLAGVNVWFQRHGGGSVIRAAGLSQRLLGAGGVTWFYLYKALMPVELIFVYPQWHIDGGKILWWLPMLAALMVTAVLWLYRKSWSRPFLFAWGFFCTALVPVMGLTDVGFMKYSLVADRYQHIAVIGVIALASAGLAAWHRLRGGRAGWAATLVALAAAGMLGFLARRQSANFHDEFALYRATLERNPTCAMVHYNLACALTETGQREEAIEHYEEALRLKPDYVEAHNNLGIMLSGSGRLREAIEHYEQARRLRPNNPVTYFNLGNAYQGLGKLKEAMESFQQALAFDPDFSEAHANLGAGLAGAGRLSEAIEHYERALQLKPDSPDVHYNLANALKEMGRYKEAIEHYKRVLQLKADDPEAHNNLGIALVEAGRAQEAIEHYKRALQIKPDYFEACSNLGIALAMSGRQDEAVEYFQQTLRMKPDYPQAHYNLGNALFQKGRLEEAIEHYREALRINPDYADAHSNLGTALLEKDRLQEAVDHYRQAIRLRNDSALVYYNLAITYAKMHESTEAVAAAGKALELARAQRQAPLAEMIEKWLNSYRAGMSGQPNPPQSFKDSLPPP